MRTQDPTFYRNRRGQAILEYVLLLSIIFSFAGLMLAGVRATRDKMWKFILCEVSAACSDCRATESAQNAPGSGVRCRN